jgi:hypothetical protein
LPAEDEVPEVEAPEDVYTRQDLNELRGLGSELYPRAIYHGYSTKQGVPKKVS